ncbi:hypothetical protein [Sphaerospermopsis torques-reginae]|uniref:Spore coat protein U domain-containing protein n=1 Tax=Sphaerospermopsis torques-reginae ITEP-024 TaxID=984208 RepID=A0ABX8X147_9CYAN|nr:hypothetical protein [Sphaerospermopsis torques-reginae]QYX32432.1 hypothetical protein K2F26_03270 [Sphaerospermopsis torques-reginae ITEP-024]
MKKIIGLISAAILTAPVLFAPVAKADQELNLDFTGLAQSNCQFTNIESGLMVAKGRDLGTIDSATSATLGTVAGATAAPAEFTVSCNANTAFFVDTPVGAASNPAFTAVSAKSVLDGGATQVEAYTASPASGSVTSDGFLPVAASTVATPNVDMTVDMNIQSTNGIPVGIYKYTVLVTAVPQ